ncbi:hypothetical protein QJS04_geneDACA002900 [Acorus gramineus]|uniref:CP-type G domain-containing protein n=1 Tax=Acorus gramineus TaxID=55184 RepID=A0AAV9BWD8_ACOGR|nr:hypothetical protein QJS04_geneDACA002900 [Acorus gramineus]
MATSVFTPVNHRPLKEELFNNGFKTLAFKSESLRSPFTSPPSLSLPRFRALSTPTEKKKVTSLSCSNKANPVSLKTKRTKKPIFSEGRDGDDAHLVCPGCGVFMQDKDRDLPGFYRRPVSVREEEEEIPIGFSDEFDESEAEDEEFLDGSASDSAMDGEIEGLLEDGFDWGSEDEEENSRELDGFTPAGPGFGNITEEWLEKQKKVKVSKSEKKRKVREEAKREREDVMVCARCHSLRNYGHVKNEEAENMIPDFDFDRLITARLMKLTGSTAAVVVMVVDVVDFDGSFPKRAVKSLFKALEGNKKELKHEKLPKLVLVATKVDLLPSQVSPTRLDRWVRNRAKAGGAPKLSGVYLVSAHKDLGVRNLLSFIKGLAGPRGNVWVIGAQNAGKSTLINAFAKKEGVKITRLTEAAIPGTTLGILRIGGILPAKAKMYDTPGLLHPYLVTMRLNREEHKMVEIRKELQPRTYRIKAGQTVHVGGLMRLDLTHASVETIYVTVWASPNISLHLGKTENAEETWRKHVGIRLQPPIGQDRASELGEWKSKEFNISGISWDVNSVDMAVSGLGWFSLGLKGDANLTLWTFGDVEVTLRDPLVTDRARFLERPGFWLPKAISEAIGHQTRLEAQLKKVEEERESSFEEVSV